MNLRVVGKSEVVDIQAGDDKAWDLAALTLLDMGPDQYTGVNQADAQNPVEVKQKIVAAFERLGMKKPPDIEVKIGYHNGEAVYAAGYVGEKTWEVKGETVIEATSTQKPK